MNHRDRLISVKVQRVLISCGIFAFYEIISLDFLPINVDARDVYEHKWFLV